MGEDRSAWASADPVRLAKLVEEFRRREEAGSTLDEIAVWLKFQTTSLGDSGRVLSEARQIPTPDAYSELRRTSVWRNASRRFRIVLPNGSLSEFGSVSGRTFSVGDTFNMPNVPEAPHHPEPGRGTVWRVAAVESDDDPAFTARITVEPVRRLEPRA